MSHTVIPDHRDRMLQLENVSNRLVHHCRIVNVKWKAGPDPLFASIMRGALRPNPNVTMLPNGLCQQTVPNWVRKEQARQLGKAWL